MCTRTLMFRKRGREKLHFWSRYQLLFIKKKKNSISKWLAEKYYLAGYFSIWLTLPDSPHIYSTIKFLIISWLRLKKKKNSIVTYVSHWVVSLCLMIYPEKLSISVHIDLNLSLLSLNCIALCRTYAPSFIQPLSYIGAFIKYSILCNYKSCHNK